MKCCFHGTTCTSNVLLFLRYILWFKLNSLKVKNISFWKIRCCEALESTYHVSLQIAKIGKTIMRILFFTFCGYLWRTFEFVIPILFLLVIFSCKMTFSATIIRSPPFVLLFIFELPPIYKPFELLKNTHSD